MQNTVFKFINNTKMLLLAKFLSSLKLTYVVFNANICLCQIKTLKQIKVNLKNH